MTIRSKSDVIADLLGRGIADVWATEDEAATLSGMGTAKFREKLADLEARGFPKKDPANNKRFIPAILDFWKQRAQPNRQAFIEVTPQTEKAKERFHA